MADRFASLFAPVYPDVPGFKAQGPSEEAARVVTGSAKVLRARVLEILRQRWPAGLTADEVATELRLSVLSVRPRCSELHRMGEIRATGERRKNQSGLSATVWTIAPELPAHSHLISEAIDA